MLAAVFKPRLLGAAGVLAFAVGVALVYAGLASIGPMAMLGGILLVILAAIAWTTPEDQVEAARLALARRASTPAEATRRKPRVYDLPGE